MTPHLTGFIEGDEHPCERTILQAGTYNLGFLVVTRQPDLARFLGWWQEKLEFQCVVDTERGLFVDQKWIDLVPGLFPGVRILLCSDGLVDGLYDHQLIDILRQNESDDAAAKILVANSVTNSGRDNTTALVIEIG